MASESMAQVMASLFTTTYCTNTSLTLLFYDWLLCLDQELACIWRGAGALNAATLVYALSRFPLMFGTVFTLATIFPMPMPSCHFVFWAENVVILLSRFAIGMFSAFRVYAVSGKKMMPTLVVTLLSTVPIVNSLVIYIKFTTVEDLPSPFNCSGLITLSSEWTFRLAVISRSSLIIADAIVIAITWWNTYSISRIEKAHHLGTSLGGILLRDGSLYFIVLALLNGLQIALTAVSVDSITSNASYVTIFIDPISAILTSRFILNLRQVDRASMPSTVSSSGEMEFVVHSSSTLPRFVASFGEPLHITGTAEASDEGNGDAGRGGMSGSDFSLHE